MGDPQGNLYADFGRELQRLSGHSQRLRPEAVEEHLREILRSEGARSACAYETEFIKSLRLRAALTGDGECPFFWLDEDPQEGRQRLARVDAAVTSADYLLAETATCVFGITPQPRSLTLLPPTLIVLAPAGRLLPGLAEFHQHLQTQGDAPEELIYITGPSRTADIEKTLVLGVHGPKTLHVIVVDSLPVTASSKHVV